MTIPTDDPLRVERSTLIRASLEDVWSALTTPDSFARWYAFGGASMDLRPGGLIRPHWDEHGTCLGRIEAVEALRFFSYRLAVIPDTEPTPTNSTLVEFQFPADLPTLAGQGWDGGFALLRELLEVPA